MESNHRPPDGQVRRSTPELQPRFPTFDAAPYTGLAVPPARVELFELPPLCSHRLRDREAAYSDAVASTQAVSCPKLHLLSARNKFRNADMLMALCGWLSGTLASVRRYSAQH